MSEENNVEQPKEEVDLWDIIKKIWSKRIYIFKCAAIGLVAGVVVALSIPAEYTTNVTMAPEDSKSSVTGNMAGLAALAGVNLSNNVSGVNLTIYPDIVASTPFIVELSRITVNAKGKEMPLLNYVRNEIKVPWWTAVMRLPMKLRQSSKKKFITEDLDPYNLTREQDMTLTKIRDRIKVVVDKKTNLIKVSAKMQDAQISALVADSLTSKLQSYVYAYQTDKARRDLKFTEELYLDAQKKYYEAQEKYASYMDATQNTKLEAVKSHQERLRNEQTLAYSVYSQMAQQLESAKITLQERTPIATVIEPAKVPVWKSNTSRTMTVLLWIILGTVAGVVIIFVKESFLTSNSNSAE